MQTRRNRRKSRFGQPIGSPVPVLGISGPRWMAVKEEPAGRILLLPDSENPGWRLRWFPFCGMPTYAGRAGDPG